MQNKNFTSTKKLRISVIASLLLLPLISTEAISQTPKSSLSSGANPFAGVRQQKEIKIFIADISSGPMSENSRLYPPDEWYLSKYDGAKTADSLLKEGWSLIQIVPINAKQYYWVFAR